MKINVEFLKSYLENWKSESYVIKVLISFLLGQACCTDHSWEVHWRQKNYEAYDYGFDP